MRYLLDNAANGIRLIDACVRHGVGRFVLSSTAALFNLDSDAPIPEDAPIDPQSAYGDSKWMIERALRWAGQVHGLRHACLRYFNAAGADPAGRLGEDHRPESHLIPLVIDAALGRRPALDVLRRRLSDAGWHLRSRLRACVRPGIGASAGGGGAGSTGPVVWNLGNGAGHSVKQVIASVERVSGLKVPYQVGGAPGRGCGGAGRVVANGRRRRAGGRCMAIWTTSSEPRSPGASRTRTAMATDRSDIRACHRRPLRCCSGRRCGTAIRSCSPIPGPICLRRSTSMPAGTVRCSTACSVAAAWDGDALAGGCGAGVADRLGPVGGLPGAGARAFWLECSWSGWWRWRPPPGCPGSCREVMPDLFTPLLVLVIACWPGCPNGCRGGTGGPCRAGDVHDRKSAIERRALYRAGLAGFCRGGWLRLRLRACRRPRGRCSDGLIRRLRCCRCLPG